MIRHVVVFTWSAEADADRRRTTVEALRRLPEDVGGMTSFVVADDAGLTGGNADTVLIADFADAEAFARYAQDPVHLAVIAEHVRPWLAGRSAVQYQVRPTDRPESSTAGRRPQKVRATPEPDPARTGFRHGCARSTAPPETDTFSGEPSQPSGSASGTWGDRCRPAAPAGLPTTGVRHVLIGLGGASGRRVGLTVRADIPPPEHNQSLAGCCPGACPPTTLMARWSSSSPAADETFAGERDLPHHDLVWEMCRALSGRAVPVGDVVLVRDGRWWSYDCPDLCCVPGAGTPSRRRDEAPGRVDRDRDRRGERP